MTMASIWALATSFSRLFYRAPLGHNTGTGRSGAPCFFQEPAPADEHMLKRLALLLLLAPLSTGVPARGTYQEPDAFLAEVFADAVPEPSLIWLTGKRKKTVQQLLGHRYPSLRVRYWRRGRRSAWILEEVGKEQPITVGLVVNNGRLEKIRVLVFRESRGEEIRHPFFTDQFQDAGLNDKGDLDRTIDGISGATLSVRAMKKLARLALYLDAETSKADVTPPP